MATNTTCEDEMIKVHGKKLTANQFAKVAVARFGEGAYYWMEKVDTEDITEHEKEAISTAIEKQMCRMEQLLLGNKLKGIWF
jgi:hypothetical protein